MTIPQSEFVYSLDRRRLGCFACPIEDLNDFHIVSNAASAWGMLEQIKRAQDEKPLVYAEWVFWQRQAGSSVDRIVTTSLVEAQVAKLTKVYENPSFYNFFVAGIWDLAFIENTVADDIDFDMAAKLYTAQSY